MKQQLFISLLFLGAMTLSSCGGGNPSSQTTSEKEVQTFEEADYSHLTQPEKTIEKVRFHYHRNEKSYKNYENYYHWQIWAWNMAGGSGQAFTFTNKEDYGVYVDIPLSKYSSKVDELGFLVAITATWQKDPEEDRSVNVTGNAPGGILDIYVKTHSSKIYYDPVSALSNSLSRAVLSETSNKLVDLTFALEDEFTFEESKLHVYENDNEITNYSVNYEKPTAKLTFEQAIDISKKVEIEYVFSESWTDKVTLYYGNYYDSAEFIEHYGYDGDLGISFDNEVAPSKTNFKVWSPVSQSITLNVYETGDYVNDTNPIRQVAMELKENGVWEKTLDEDLSNKYYTYTVTNSRGTNEITDPYATSAGLNGKRGMITNFTKINNEIAGWNEDVIPSYGDSGVDASIYEIHVRDMTINPNSNVSAKNRGKFLGLTEDNTSFTDEKGTTVSTGLAHLKELGITHVQIQPFYDFSSVDESLDGSEMVDAETNKVRNVYNWGYDPQNYNVLEGSYSTNPKDGTVRIKEFKQMVMALHKAGLNIIMDVVYNHTSSTEQSNFQLLVPYYYYRTDSKGGFFNGSGCGNEISSERYMTRKFIRDSAKLWMEEYNLSGFRFDLMGLIDNQTMIDIYNDATHINQHALIYGEPWTGMATSKLVDGTNPKNLDHQKTVQASLSQPYFAGNNVFVGAFHDGIRNAVRGENGGGKGYVQGTAYTQSLLNGIAGEFSKDSALSPSQAIVYTACHDNNTLYDQLMIGASSSESFNQMYLQADTIVFTSQGIPFIQEGEDFMRTKAYTDSSGKISYEGNSYNVGDKINNMDYALKAEKVEMFKSFKELINLRKGLQELRLDSRNEIKSKLEFAQNTAAGVIQYTINNHLMVIHSNSTQDEIISVSGRVLFDTYKELTNTEISAVTLKANQSLVIEL